ncbi:MAG TPA: YciI family protein [Candidatus Sulfotelmatobacter sp.]|nr:YciI family protein [Candidatus Sulfotelmatobacter sp.]
MKYVLLFAGTMDEQDMWEKLPKEQLEESYRRVGEWFEEHGKAGRIVGGEELRGPSTATTVHIKNGKVTLTDGPFIEAKEVIGGFAVVQVKDLDEALEMAKTWPGGTMVEVRPVVEHPDH